MTQPNIVEGDYNTEFDYGTVDGTQTQSPYGSNGPEEVIFIFNSLLLLYECLVMRNVSQGGFTKGGTGMK